MAQQTEAGDISASVRAHLHHHFRGGAVECRHGSSRGALCFFTSTPHLGRKGDYAGADGFCEYKNISGLCSGVGDHCFRINDTGNGESEFDLLIIDTVSADQDNLRLLQSIHPALDHLVHPVIAEGMNGIADDGKRGNWSAAHSVHVAQGIVGGNPAESIRIIYRGGEDINRLHQAKVCGGLKDPGIIRGGAAHQQAGVCYCGQAGEHPLQISRWDL